MSWAAPAQSLGLQEKAGAREQAAKRAEDRAKQHKAPLTLRQKADYEDHSDDADRNSRQPNRPERLGTSKPGHQAAFPSPQS